LTADREKIVRELKRLQDETDVLMGKHSAKSQEMQNEVINLPETMEDMQLLLLNLREELITAKVARERVEEKLRGEASILRKQVRGEEQARRSAEERFNAELDRLRACEKDLQVEQRRRRETEGKEEKQKQSQAALRQEVESLQGEKQRLDAKVHDMKSRLAILQQDLDNSVAVQNDFVRLSQSLQMELEKIRQSEKEVRWQFEEDVDNCQNCKISLSTTKRKHWCKHCGHIFCVECVSKSVPSGPRQRPAKVCDVCHTLLVQNSAPYFSTEVPHSH
jgi:Rab GTPase-binding effector protein 1